MKTHFLLLPLLLFTAASSFAGSSGLLEGRKFEGTVTEERKKRVTETPSLLMEANLYQRHVSDMDLGKLRIGEQASNSPSRIGSSSSGS
jgi:hypothetical protein